MRDMRLFAMIVVLGMTSPAWAEHPSLRELADLSGRDAGVRCREMWRTGFQGHAHRTCSGGRPGGSFLNGTASRDVWRYRRGAGKFPAVLTFEDGVLRKLEFEK